MVLVCTFVIRQEVMPRDVHDVVFPLQQNADYTTGSHRGFRWIEIYYIPLYSVGVSIAFDQVVYRCHVQLHTLDAITQHQLCLKFVAVCVSREVLNKTMYFESTCDFFHPFSSCMFIV